MDVCIFRGECDCMQISVCCRIHDISDGQRGALKNIQSPAFSPTERHLKAKSVIN